MSKLRILYFSKRVSNYKSSSYQQDIINALSNLSEIFLYGPGFESYSINDALPDVIAKAPFTPDCIIIGHRWLSDTQGQALDPHPKLRLDQAKFPLFAFLNKEYVNFEQKIKYFRHFEFINVFSHYQDIDRYNDGGMTRFTFLPFGFSPDRIKAGNQVKKFDLSFSGILVNPNPGVGQSNTRVSILNRLFYCVGDHPICKRNEFSEISLFWNAIPRSVMFNRNIALYRCLQSLFPKYGRKYLSPIAYSELLGKSKIVLNTHSPLGLIGPRYFETMAAGAMVLSEDSPHIEKVFPPSTYATFRSDLTLANFTRILWWYIQHDQEREALAKSGHDFAWKECTWDNRVKKLLNCVLEAI